MIKAKHLKVRSPYENMVREHHPIQFGAVVRPNWTESTYMVYLTGDYVFEGKEGWFIQGYPLKDGEPYKLGCGWLNDLGERTGDLIKTRHKNGRDEVRVLWEPERLERPARQMELSLNVEEAEAELQGE